MFNGTNMVRSDHSGTLKSSNSMGEAIYSGSRAYFAGSPGVGFPPTGGAAGEAAPEGIPCGGGFPVTAEVSVKESGTVYWNFQSL